MLERPTAAARVRVPSPDPLPPEISPPLGLLIGPNPPLTHLNPQLDSQLNQPNSTQICKYKFSTHPAPPQNAGHAMGPMKLGISGSTRQVKAGQRP